jgi:hypothetical protein
MIPGETAVSMFTAGDVEPLSLNVTGSPPAKVVALPLVVTQLVLLVSQ